MLSVGRGGEILEAVKREIGAYYNSNINGIGNLRPSFSWVIFVEIFTNFVVFLDFYGVTMALMGEMLEITRPNMTDCCN